MQEIEATLGVAGPAMDPEAHADVTDAPMADVCPMCQPFPEPDCANCTGVVDVDMRGCQCTHPGLGKRHTPPIDG